MIPEIYPQNPRNEIVVGMPADEYRAACGISPSEIKIAAPELSFGRAKGSPARFKAQRDGLIPKPRKRAFELGTLAHEMALEKSYIVLTDERLEQLEKLRIKRKTEQLYREHRAKKFMCNFAEAKAFKQEHDRAPNKVEQKELIRARAEREASATTLNENSQEMVKYRANVAKDNAVLIDPSDSIHAQALAMNKALRMPFNSKASSLLRLSDPSRVEVSIFCVIEIPFGKTKIPIQLKGRPDLITGGGTLYDYKTAESVELLDFSKETINRGYFLSMGMYLLMLQTLAKHSSKKTCDHYGLNKLSAVAYIAQEKTAPYEAVVYDAPESHTAAGQFFGKTALMNLARCYLAEHNGESNAWRTNENTYLEDPFYPPAISAYIANFSQGKDVA